MNLPWTKNRTGKIHTDWGDISARTKVVPPDSVAHDYYLVQTLPDFLVTHTGAFDLFNALYDKHREGGGFYDPVRLIYFMTFIKIVNTLPLGDYADFGVGVGQSASYDYRLMKENSNLLLFDTFSGFDIKDVEKENQLFGKKIPVDMLDTYPPELVEQQIYQWAGGKRDIGLEFIEGVIPNSFHPYRSRKFRFASIDMDLYQPTATLLDELWECIVPGGALVFHDYGCSLFPGVAKAVDEFFLPQGITPIPLPDMTVSAIVFKPRNTQGST